MKYTIPKGLFDIVPFEPLPEDAWRTSDRWQYLESVIRKTAQDYNFREIRTPSFERTELFIRGVGESSDIVSKEMYTFLDKGERSMTLRPEGTAPAMRAFIENKMHTHPGFAKYFYIGPMFRYERPQAGRYRQHHQFGAEAIGNGRPEQDVEMIDMLCELYRRLGIKDLTVLINSVGDEASRESFKKALHDYLQPHFHQLSADSQVRFTKNILRILDSKDPGDQELLKNCPNIIDALSEPCREHFGSVLRLLEKIGIRYQVTPQLVRGLDYYNKTVFEIVSGNLGAQNTIGAGGRYDGLIANLGGPDLPSVGFATGMERILQTMYKQQVPIPSAPHPKYYLIGLGDQAVQFCFNLATQLRHHSCPAEVDLQSKKISQALQLADAIGAEYALIIGDAELQSQTAQLKQLKTREAKTIAFSDLLHTLLNWN